MVEKLPGASAEKRRKRSTLGVVIVAGGASRRMKGPNKLFASLGGKPVLAWSVDTCRRCETVKQIVLVLNDRDLDRGQELLRQRDWDKVTVCSGGARRQDSVKEGLRHVKGCSRVMIHDGARPFLTLDLIKDGMKIVGETGAAVAAVPVKDTIKLSGNRNLVRETLKRERLWAAQTPQIFSFDIITRAYGNLTTEVTDDCSAVAQLGYKVKLYMGDYRNIKITTPEDLSLARIIAREWKQEN